MFKVAALYKFYNIKNPIFIHKHIKSELSKFSVKGTIIIGEEGINGTISSKNKSDLANAISIIKSINGFKDIDIKYSNSTIDPFIRLKLKLKKEIVTIGNNSIDPTNIVGDYVEPVEWNELITHKNTVLIDSRNNYEYAIGNFKNSINPRTTSFRDFPNWIEKQNFSEIDKKTKNFAMYCTGGIRCEKATSLMKEKGFLNVFHLKGGILKYFEKVKEQDSLWNGECFVFDDRVSVNHQLNPGAYDMCHGCRMPIQAKDKESKKFIPGVSCDKCFDTKTEKQKSRYKSRQKQVELAKSRNEKHIGPKEGAYN